METATSGYAFLARVPPEGHRPCREHVGARRHWDDVRTVQAVTFL